MPEFLKGRIRGVLLSAASVIVLMQLILPSMFDFMFDLVLLGILYASGKVQD